MDQLSSRIAKDEHFLALIKLAYQFRDSVAATVQPNRPVDWEKLQQNAKVALKEIRKVRRSLRDGGERPDTPSIPASLSVAFGMSEEQILDFISNVHGQLRELQAKFKPIAELDSQKVRMLFFAATQEAVPPPGDSGSDDSESWLAECIREAWENLQKEEEREKQCMNECEATLYVEHAMLFATWLTASIACTALVLPPAQVICAAIALANWLYWSTKASKAAEDCIEQCELKYS